MSEVISAQKESKKDSLSDVLLSRIAGLLFWLVATVAIGFVAAMGYVNDPYNWLLWILFILLLLITLFVALFTGMRYMTEAEDKNDGYSSDC